MPQDNRIVGIDISKAKADACLRSPLQRQQQPSTPQGQAAMVAWLHANGVTTAVMEASGGYERSWASALRQAGIAVRVIDPKRVRLFAKSAGRHAKNDPIDAEMIAWFGDVFADAPAQVEDAERETLDRIVTARRLLIGQTVQLRQLAEHPQPPVVVAAQRAALAALKTQVAALDAAAAAMIAASTRLAERARLIRSVPGLGPQFTAGALAWLPELGSIGDKQLAALVGVAPYDDQSGGQIGQRHIKGGRVEIRNLLYMATLGAATLHNPVLQAYYQRLRAEGKKAKVALVACMRKMLCILNTMLARGTTWNPPPNLALVTAASAPRCGRRLPSTA